MYMILHVRDAHMSECFSYMGVTDNTAKARRGGALTYEKMRFLKGNTLKRAGWKSGQKTFSIRRAILHGHTHD